VIIEDAATTGMLHYAYTPQMKRVHSEQSTRLVWYQNLVTVTTWHQSAFSGAP